MIRLARKASSASTDVTWARSGMALALVQVFLYALGFSQQIRRMLVGDLDEPLERLHGLLELLRELHVLLVLPGVAQRRKPRLQRHDLVLEVGVEPLQLLGEAPHLLGIHDCLGHSVSFCLCLWLAGAPGAPRWRLRLTQTCPVPARSANLNHIGCSPGAHLDTATSRRPHLPRLLWRRGLGRGGRHAARLPLSANAFVPLFPTLSPRLAGGEREKPRWQCQNAPARQGLHQARGSRSCPAGREVLGSPPNARRRRPAPPTRPKRGKAVIRPFAVRVAYIMRFVRGRARNEESPGWLPDVLAD